MKRLKNEQVEQFYAEASVLKMLNFPNIVKFYGLYQDSLDEANSKPYYIVMEFCKLGSLDNFLKRHQLPIEDLLVLAKDAAAGSELNKQDAKIECPSSFKK